jgi:hypothetical protein
VRCDESHPTVFVFFDGLCVGRSTAAVQGHREVQLSNEGKVLVAKALVPWENEPQRTQRSQRIRRQVWLGFPGRGALFEPRMARIRTNGCVGAAGACGFGAHEVGWYAFPRGARERGRGTRGDGGVAAHRVRWYAFPRGAWERECRACGFGAHGVGWYAFPRGARERGGRTCEREDRFSVCRRGRLRYMESQASSCHVQDARVFRGRSCLRLGRSGCRCRCCRAG